MQRTTAVRPTHMRAIFTYGRFTFLEAVRSRLGWVALVTLVASLGVGQFIDQMALTESQPIRAAVLGAMLRLAAVFLIASFVITSMVREHNDKGLELLLSLAAPRHCYLLGKWLGFVWAAIALAGAFALPLALSADAPRVLAWGLSLALELVVVASASLLCVLTFSHVVSGLAAVGAFYVLSRLISTLQMIGDSAVAPLDSLAFQFGAWSLRAIGVLLPRLDLFTRTAWLTGDAVPFADLPALGLQSAVYSALLLCAAAIDLTRKNI